MAAARMSGKKLAALTGMSQNYLATRLRDEKPFTLDDISEIIDALYDDIDPQKFVEQACERNSESIWHEVYGQDAKMSQGKYTLAARESNDDAEAEWQQGDA